MAAWLLPALKAVLPHVGTIISAATPVFTRRKSSTTADPPAELPEQITELQAAATQNAAHIRELAAQLQTALGALEQAALLADRRLRRAQWMCAGAALFSFVSLGLALYLLLAR